MATEAPTHGEDVEEEFRSLMEGLRTTLPGAQLVTAFLLTVPLHEKWDELIRQERVAYYVAFATAVLGTLLLMAPSSHQRLRTGDDGVARRHQRHVQAAVQIAVGGSLLLGVALVAVAFMVTSFVLGTPAAVVMTVAVAVSFLWSWYYLPLVAFEKD
jgi:hypothetical protein